MKALPHDLLESLRGLPGFDEQKFIEVHREENRITSIRKNPFKPVELDFALGENVSWNNNGYYLKERPSFTHDPLFHAGCYYVQEAGSMFIEHALKSVVDFNENVRVLDLCGAPGGKSTLINSLINEESLLVSNEIIKGRADILSYNLSKWGTCNSVATNNDPEKFSSLSGYFDVIVVDAPCSGSGLFRKQPDAIDEWSLNNVQLCCGRQKKILNDILPALKEDGILVYSTCSYSLEENENITDYLVLNEMEYLPVPLEKEWGITDTGKGYRFYPHNTGSEGFFCAVFRKNFSSGRINERKTRAAALSGDELELMSGFLKTDGKLFHKNAGRIHFFNEAVWGFIAGAGKNMYFKKAGTVAGEIKGKDLVPHHELALSVDCNYPNRNLGIRESLQFLRKQNLTLEQSERGFSLISYKNYGIGWAKILSNRINNYLPNEHRIIN